MRCDNPECSHSIEHHGFASPSPCRNCACEGFIKPNFGPFNHPPEGSLLTNNKEELRKRGHNA